MSSESSDWDDLFFSSSSLPPLWPTETNASYLDIGGGDIVSFPVDDPNPLTTWNTTFQGALVACATWRPSQHILFQMANGCFFASYLAPNSRRGLLFMHCVLILGFLLFSTWAWNIICAPDVFSWNFAFMILNMGQMLYIIYQMRPVKFEPELEPIYHCLFQPLSVSRLLFKRLVSSEYAQLLSLHAGEAYAMQKLTRTDRLGLLVSGKINVMSDSHFLHHIIPKQFLDSPEFESSRAAMEDKFKVSIIAATPCLYLFWQRSALEYIFVKEPYLATVMATLIARDITTKLYAMNKKIVTEKGSHLDIRLPSLTSTLTLYESSDGTTTSKSPLRSARVSISGNNVGGRRRSYSPESGGGSSRSSSLANGRLLSFGGCVSPEMAPLLLQQMEPLPEMPSCDDLDASECDQGTGSSNYHSCDMEDAESCPNDEADRKAQTNVLLPRYQRDSDQLL